jgi:hypothetical protein
MPYDTVQILDFYHASEYVTKASFAAYPGNEAASTIIHKMSFLGNRIEKKE